MTKHLETVTGTEFGVAFKNEMYAKQDELEGLDKSEDEKKNNADLVPDPYPHPPLFQPTPE